MAHQSDSIVGFKHRLANYFERISGDTSHVKHIIDTLPKSYTTPESQDTLMRFISDRCGIEEAEAVEELDYVTARLERERRNERFERLLEPWSTEQLEVSLRRYFGEYDHTQLPSVSALVTFYRGREITLIRELELQYRRPLLLYREDDDMKDQDEAGAMEIANALTAGGPNSGIVTDGTQPGAEDDDDDEDGGDVLVKKRKKGIIGASSSVADDFSKMGAAALDDNDDADPDNLGPISPGGGGSGGKLTSKLSSKRKKTGIVSAGVSSSAVNGGEGNSGNNNNSNNANNTNSGGGSTTTAAGATNEALRIRTNFEEITVDSMQHFEKEILKFLLDIRQELHDRIEESELLAQQYATAASSGGEIVTGGSGGGGGGNDGENGESFSSSSPTKRRALRKSSMLRRRLMMASQIQNQNSAEQNQNNNNSMSNNNSITGTSLGDDLKGSFAATAETTTTTNQQPQQQHQQTHDEEAIAKSVIELTKELSALPRKRLARVEKMMQIIPLIARAVTPVYKSQLFLYLGFYCSLRIEARKVMQKRIAGALHDAPLKADENFQRRSAAIFTSEKDSRAEILNHERRMWARMDPLFYREGFLRTMQMLIDEESSKRDEIEFDELCGSSVARAKLRSLLFLERSYVELNSFV